MNFRETVGPIVAAGAVVTLTVGVVLAFSFGGNDTAPSAEVGQDRLDQIERELTDSFVASAGTRQDRAAQSLSSHTAFQRAIVECVRAAGWDYTPVPADVPGPGMPPERGISNTTVIEMVSSQSLGVREEYEYLATREAEPLSEPVNSALYAVPETDRDAYLATIDRCTPQESVAHDAGALPAIAQRMLDELQGIVLAAADDPQVRDLMAQYPACLSEHGYRDVVELQDLRTIFHTRYAELLRSGERPDGQPWKQAVEDEAAAARADAECRGAAHNRTLEVLAGPLADFREAHAADVQRARTQMQADSKRAVEEYFALANS